MTSPGPDWVEQARRFAAGSGLADLLGVGRPAGAPVPGAPAGDPPGDHAAECRWCPVCAGLAALRGQRPDLVEGLADVLGTAAAALRAHAAATPAGQPAGPGAATPAPDAAAGPPPPVPVQRIDVA